MNISDMNSLRQPIALARPFNAITVLRPRANALIFDSLKRLALFCVRSAGLIALCLATPFLAAADSWQWLSPSPTGNRLNSFVHGGGLFVGVGNSGEIVTSPDGATWTIRDSGIQDRLLRVVYGQGRFWAIGSSNLLSSSDGIVWTKQNAPANLADIAVGNNLLVSIAAPTSTGHPYRLLASPDGINWTSSDTTAQPLRVLFANGVFVVVDTSGQALSSTDGVTWTTTQIPDITTAPFFAAGNGSFLVSLKAKTYLSTNGTTWREVTSHPSSEDGSGQILTIPYLEGGVAGSTLGFAGGYFYIQQSRYAGNAYRYHRSQNGETWESATLFGNADLSTLASGGGILVGTELDTLYAGPNRTSFAIHSSSDGLAWTTRSNTAINSDSSLVYGLGRFFAGGKVSSDTLTWISTPFEPTHAAGDLVFRITSQFAGGSVSTTINSNAVTSVAVSADGLTSLPIDVKMATPRSVAFGSGRYVIAGDSGNVSSSTDGLTWTAGTSGTSSDLQAVLFASNRFVAIGKNGALITSPDGLAWTVHNTGTTIDFLSIAAGQDRIVVGTAGPTTAVPPLTLSGNLTIQIATARRSDALIWFDGEFTSVEHHSLNNQATSITFAKSTDGTTWNDFQINYPGAASGRALVATGNGTALMMLPAGRGWSLEKLFTAVFQKRISGSATPLIAHHPAATTVARGETATFSVGATGSGPLAYQWNRNGTPIAGATTQIFSLPLTKDSDAGDYTVTVSNSLGSVTSASARLTVGAPDPLVITQQPVGGTLYASQSFVLSVEVTGSGPIAYQWRKNGTTVATSPRYEIYAASYSMDNYTGTYDVVITSPSSTVTSQAVIVSRSGPSVTVSQSGNTVTGGTLTVTATATGKSPFTYAWSRAGGRQVAGAADATLVLSNLTSADSSSYSVTVTDADGLSTQAFFVVSVSNSAPTTAPTFVAQTTSRTVATGGVTTFSVSADGAASYQWQFRTSSDGSWTNLADGGPYSGVTTPTLTITGATAAMNGYQYRNLATNASGNSTSNAATLAINNDPALVRPIGIARDATGNLYVADASANVIRMITPAGAASVFAGTAGNAGSTNGTGSAARFNQPSGLAFDSAGNLYVADTGNATIRKITAAGVVTTFAGDSVARGNVDATGNAARFNHPVGLAVDATGNIYVADTFTHTVRKITSGGIVTTLAGANAVAGSTDGSGVTARFSGPAGVTADASGTVYVADTGNNTIRKITSNGAVTTLAGLPGVAGSNDGTGNNALFSQPTHLAVDANGTVYVADTGNALIRRITSSGVVTLLAGVPGIAGLSDGVGLDALLDQPHGLVLDGSGNLFVADTGNAALRKIAGNGTVTTLALVAASAPVTNPPTPPPSSTGNGGTSSPATNSGGGGGGAMNPWLAGSLALLFILRRRRWAF